MTLREYKTLLNQHAPEIARLMRHTMPVIAGQIAVSHFKNNFRQSGFLNSGLHPWTPSKRIGTSNYAGGNYRTLLSGRNHLMNSVQYIPGDARVTVTNKVVYAAIHNEGGIINSHPTVTGKMRKFAWRQFYETMGIKKGDKIPKDAIIPPEAQKWRSMALTKKTKLDIRIIMPKRQFIGESKELDDKIKAKIESKILKIFGI